MDWFKNIKFSKDREAIWAATTAFLVMYAAMITQLWLAIGIALGYLIWEAFTKVRKSKNKKVRWLVYFLIIVMLINMALAYSILNA